jgi:hypothetical protein
VIDQCTIRIRTLTDLPISLDCIPVSSYSSLLTLRLLNFGRFLDLILLMLAVGQKGESRQ